MQSQHSIPRRKSRPIRVGRVTIGGDAPIAVQTMTNTRTEDVEATVAQVARMTCAVARDGELPSLSVVRSVGGVAPHRPAPERIEISPANLALVRRALRAVVTRGTAAGSGLDSFDAAGKSGTAQTGRRDGGSPDHAWFTGYAPASSPRVVVTVLLEFEGRHGGDAAAPVAAEILRHVFSSGSER